MVFFNKWDLSKESKVFLFGLGAKSKQPSEPTENKEPEMYIGFEGSDQEDSEVLSGLESVESIVDPQVEFIGFHGSKHNIGEDPRISVEVIDLNVPSFDENGIEFIHPPKLKIFDHDMSQEETEID